MIALLSVDWVSLGVAESKLSPHLALWRNVAVQKEEGAPCMRPELVTSSAAPTVLHDDCICRIRRPDLTHPLIEAGGRIKGSLRR